MNELLEKTWVKVLAVLFTALATSLVGYFKSSSENETKTAASYETLAAEVGKLQDMAEKNSIEIARIQGQLSVKEPVRAARAAKPPEPSEPPESVAEPAPVKHFTRLPRFNEAVQKYQEKK
jgi:hypothetical protein